MEDRTISAAWLKGIVEMLGAAGLDMNVLLKDTGLRVSALNDPHHRVSSDIVNVLWESAARHSGNPAIGLAKPEVARPGIYDVVSYSMMSCPTLRDAFDRLVRYLRIVSTASTVELRKDKDGLWAIYKIYGGDRIVANQRYDFGMVTLLNFLRWITHHHIRPLKVVFAYPAPADPTPYYQAFCDSVQFGASEFGALISNADLNLPFRTSNPALVELHDRYAGEYLDRLDNAGVSFRTQELIIRRLPEGEPLRADIAKVLCLTERTLQRRLEGEGTTFNRLVEKTRRDLAKQYLTRQSMTLEQTAYLLGFADQSTFCRACKRWFNMTPGQYRAELQQAQNQP